MRIGLVIAFFCCLWVAIFGQYNQPVYSYTFFDATVISDDTVLSWICWINNKSVDCTKYAKEQKVLDKKLSTLFLALEALPEYKRAPIVSKIEKVIPKINLLASKQTLESKAFMMVYVRVIFQDIVSYYKYQQNLIKIPLVDLLWRKKEIPTIRREIIRQLISHWWYNFIERPFIWNDRTIAVHDENREQYDVLTDVSMRDDLDVYIQWVLKWDSNKEIVVSPKEYNTRWKIALFKNFEDLQFLWYNVVSHRKRFTKDEEYRRYNISKSFALLWNVRVLNPWETISFLKGSQFDPDNEEHYKEWKIIFLDDEIDDYGWGLCGWSTALFQWVVMNKWLEISARNHTKRYWWLYTATINWDGLLKDRWSIEYISSYDKSYKIKNKEGRERTTNGQCYKRKIHWEETTKCYNC